MRRSDAPGPPVWERTYSTRALVDFRPIRAAIQDSDVANLAPAEDDFEAEEGAVVLRYHKARERRPELARKKRAQVLAATGKLECEVCTFDFGARYGEHGEGFMEVHHRTPVSELAAGAKTRLSDLALVCANCHRMLHRGGLLSLQALRTRLALAR